ncbi:Lrp/AsnC family transcriptional regulator [Novosphingobium mangrovi (ex Hu et al. 2023)]|uniref:Lrp/AsnC family transcriptional regulator n=1 Tax=Novosphingobium mangrovi (ex Hu et al. 2023) TaxID=2930094 RepID=A0ABT0AFZ7_9SPHN|nr:Lrp/AsnC family transcriptional regulator [Novosphingobium mangrovi (ex Hu et al. 2023)]MCJ1962128.1 Lrp/AsnC family transcriptional regulator [Novosphingobium mangrovi (ex Hu et al. 2023)]
MALLAPEKLNLGISAFVNVRLRVQSREADKAFRERIMSLPEVVSCDYTTGDMDFILRIWTRDLEHYSEFISDKLLVDDLTQSVTTYVVMKQMKSTTQLPLEYL